jgi:hypothetical protein
MGAMQSINEADRLLTESTSFFSIFYDRLGVIETTLNVLGLFEDRPVSIRLVERVRAVD